MDIEYPDNVELTDEELLAISLHIKLDKKLGHTDKATWPKWLVNKMIKAVNNPLKGGDLNVT